jgi:hypothetical protein
LVNLLRNVLFSFCYLFVSISISPCYCLSFSSKHFCWRQNY